MKARSVSGSGCTGVGRRDDLRRQMRSSLGTTQWHLMMAASSVAVIPILVIYLAAQKYFVKGIALSGIKG